MLLQVGLLAASYVGAKLFEKHKKKKAAEELKNKPIPEEADLESSEAHPPTAISEDEGYSLEQFYLHHSKVSSGTMVLFGLRKFLPILGPIGMATYIYSAIPYMRDVERSLVKDKKVNVDVLFFMADLLTLGLGQYFTAAFGLYLMHSGKAGVERAKDSSKKMIMGVFDQLPQDVWVIKDGKEVEIPLKEIKSSDILVVNSGGVIPVDGEVSSGMASVDQHALTGESQPAEKEAGDRVFANTTVITGRIEIRVEKSGLDTTAAKISQILEHSTDFKSQAQLKGERWADKATLPMVLTAGAALPFIGPASTAVFINSHIGNRIRLLAPMGTLRHITVAASEGILVKDGRALENLSHIDTVLFDKTGTLTTDEPEVTRVITCNGFEEADILTLAATAESKQSHPIAKAIMKKAEETNVVAHEIHDSKYKLGYGITVFIENRVIRVGSARFLASEGIETSSEIDSLMSESQASGNTIVMVGVNDQIGGLIELQPQIRPESRKLIEQLKEFGIQHIAIVSGDHRQPTEKLAHDLGMDEFFHDVLPEAKADIVEQLQAEGRSVCFIGDGINDSIAMKKANVSISLAGATTVATDMAEVILMDGSLSGLGRLFELSYHLDSCLKKCLKYTVVPGAVNLAGAFVLNFQIFTSLIVNIFFSGMAVASAMQPPAPPVIEEEFEEVEVEVDSDFNPAEIECLPAMKDSTVVTDVAC